MEEKKINFQESLKRLDEIVEKISSKALSLDESLALYEEGNRIIQNLQKILDESEAKVEKVVEIK